MRLKETFSYILVFQGIRLYLENGRSGPMTEIDIFNKSKCFNDYEDQSDDDDNALEQLHQNKRIPTSTIIDNINIECVNVQIDQDVLSDQMLTKFHEYSKQHIDEGNLFVINVTVFGRSDII